MMQVFDTDTETIQFQKTPLSKIIELYEQRFTIDFAEHGLPFVNAAQEYLSMGKSGVLPGPLLHVLNEKTGDLTNVYTAYYDLQRADLRTAVHKGSLFEQAIFLLAIDPTSGEILGFKNNFLHRFYDYIAVDDLYATSGGRGTASVLETASAAMLASASKVWRMSSDSFLVNVDDANYRDAVALLSSVDMESSDYDPSAHTELAMRVINERQRWMALLGPEGTAGNSLSSSGLGRLSGQYNLGLNRNTTEATILKTYIENKNGRKLLRPELLDHSCEEPGVAEVQKTEAWLAIGH
jgi:hypothetical protein